MEENDSISASTSYTDTEISSNAEIVIEQETEANKYKIDKISSIIENLRRENPNQDTTHENLNDVKGIYNTHLTEQMKGIEIHPPEAFIEALQTCEQVLKSKIKTCLDLSKNFHSAVDEKEKEKKIFEKRIEIMDALKSKIEADYKEKEEALNGTKVHEEINEKHNECKKDLKFVLDKLYPGDPNITNLLQELYTNNKTGESGGYITISNIETSLIFDLKENDVIEFHPTLPNQIKFISLS